MPRYRDAAFLHPVGGAGGAGAERKGYAEHQLAGRPGVKLHGTAHRLCSIDQPLPKVSGKRPGQPTLGLNLQPVLPNEQSKAAGIESSKGFHAAEVASRLTFRCQPNASHVGRDLKIDSLIAVLPVRLQGSSQSTVRQERGEQSVAEIAHRIQRPTDLSL
jgi:hypothetical protein